MSIYLLDSAIMVLLIKCHCFEQSLAPITEQHVSGGTWSGVNYRCVHKEMGLVGFLLGVFTQSYLSNF